MRLSHLSTAVVMPLVLTTLAALPTRAQVDNIPKAAPDVSACQACHGRNGISRSQDIPNLAGQKETYLFNQLSAFKSGERRNDLMSAIAVQLREEDMRSLARYWSQQPVAAVDPHRARQASTASTLVAKMVMPAEFPAGYTLYETITDRASGSVTRRYANSTALVAARASKPFPHGSIIIVANHQIASGSTVVGPAQSYAGMESRAGWGADVPALIRNGDWGYALFTADRQRRDTVDQAQCLACHKPKASDSYVFTLKALSNAGS